MGKVTSNEMTKSPLVPGCLDRGMPSPGTTLVVKLLTGLRTFTRLIRSWASSILTSNEKPHSASTSGTLHRKWRSEPSRTKRSCLASRIKKTRSSAAPGCSSSPSPAYVSRVPALKPGLMGSSMIFSAGRPAVTLRRVIFIFLTRPAYNSSSVNVTLYTRSRGLDRFMPACPPSPANMDSMPPMPSAAPKGVSPNDPCRRRPLVKN
mmetsp:Transcript_19953/g.46027  ORF Transcript_19953/g.46027 Transcript_19953/m.46027 type:complete len:206 (-) Transcript_19953:425-1042(-)